MSPNTANVEPVWTINAQTASCFEFSLCLSRACLGKLIVLYINGDAHQVMRGWSTPHAGGPLSCTYTDLCAEVFPGAPMADGRPGEKNVLFEPFMYKNDLFTKTGSGQT